MDPGDRTPEGNTSRDQVSTESGQRQCGAVGNGEASPDSMEDSHQGRAMGIVGSELSESGQEQSDSGNQSRRQEEGDAVAARHTRK